MAQSVRVPLVIENGVLFVRATLNDAGPLLFVLDPGAGDFLTSYGSGRLGGKPARTLRIGSATIAGGYSVLPGDPQQIDPRHDIRFGAIAGSIGPRVLQHFAVRVDYGARSLTLIPFSNVVPPRGATAMPLGMDSFGLPVFTAAADGVSGRFEVDIRAPSSLLMSPFVQHHGFAAKYSSKPVLKRSPLATQYRIDSVSVGPYTVRHASVWFSNATKGKFASREVAGLIGNDVFSHFILTLDYHAHRLYIQPRAM